jgi:hypothetical protein
MEGEHGLVKTLTDRLLEVEGLRTQLADQIAELQAQARLMNDEHSQIRALLAIYQATPVPGAGTPHDGQVPGPADIQLIEPVDGDVTLRPLASSWAEAAAEILRKDQRPIHYRVLHEKLRALGHAFGGQNPPATFLSLLVRDKNFIRAGRGSYWLADLPIPRDAAPELPPVAVTRRARSVRRLRRRIA